LANTIQILLPSIAYGILVYKNDEEGKKQFYKSFFSTIATTHLLKWVTQKKRPDNTDTRSFPSGHTSASFQGAVFMDRRHRIKYRIFAYISAAFVGFSRIHARKHDLWDVFFGALIGSGFSCYFTTSDKSNNIKIQPIIDYALYSDISTYGIKIIIN